MRIPRALTAVALGWVAAFAVFGLAAPLGAVLARAFASDTGGAGGGLFDPTLLSIARATVVQAALSTFVATLLGLPLGLWIGSLAARGWRGAAAARVLLATPYGVPTVVAGMVGVTWLGRTGWLTRLGIAHDWAYSMTAVVILHVLLNAPWVALRVALAREHVPADQLEAARTLGAGPGRRAWWIVRPHVQWALAGAASQVFGLCAMSFALVLLLGGGPPVETLETALYARVRYGTLDLASAAVCAFWELLITLLPWVAVTLLQSRQARLVPVTAQLSAAATGSRPRGARPSRLASITALLLCALALAPFAAFLGAGTLRPLGAPEVSSSLLEPLRISLALAAFASVAAVLTALAGVIAAARFRHVPAVSAAISVVLSIPSGLSALVLGLGFWLAYGAWIDPFEGSFLAIASIQAMIFLPLAFRAFWPVALSAQTRLLEAAATLGASPARAFWLVEWPRWRGVLGSAAAVVAGASLGEVAAVSLFYSENLVPLPLLITRWMSQYRFEDANAIAALLFLLSTGIIATVTLLNERGTMAKSR